MYIVVISSCKAKRKTVFHDYYIVNIKLTFPPPYRLKTLIFNSISKTPITYIVKKKNIYLYILTPATNSLS